MIFLPVKNLGKAFHNIDNDFITEKECNYILNFSCSWKRKEFNKISSN
jgi:hypothetical protein